MKKGSLARVMRRISLGKCSRAEAARLLGVGERQVNRLMLEHGAARPPGKAAAAAQERRLRARARREVRGAAALLVVKGLDTPEDAARAAGCSVRTIHRWAAKLKNSTKSARKQQKYGENGAKTAKKSRD